jgi:hypothetical protein
VLGLIFWASAAVAVRNVEVWFYRSPTPSVWCHLSDSLGSVECIQDPCQEDRERSSRARAEAEGAKREAEVARSEAEEAKEEARKAKRDLCRLRLVS